MSDLSLQMGSFLQSDHPSIDKWKDDRVFTGDNPCYPIELFIALMEGEALLLQHDQAKVANNAWCLLSPAQSDSPCAEQWRDRFQQKYKKVRATACTLDQRYKIEANLIELWNLRMT